MFALAESGERAGSGMTKIFSGWAQAGYAEPGYETSFDPDRTVLRLPLHGAEDSDVGADRRSTGQVAGQVTGQVAEDERSGNTLESADVRKANLAEFCLVPRSRQEMQEHIGIESRSHFNEAYLRPLLAEGRLIMTIPDKPNSRNQRYIANPSHTSHDA